MIATENKMATTRYHQEAKVEKIGQITPFSNMEGKCGLLTTSYPKFSEHLHEHWLFRGLLHDRVDSLK